MSGHPHLSRDRVGPNAAGQQRQGGLKAVASESYPSRESGDMWRHRPGSSLPAEAGAGLGHVTVYAAGSSGPSWSVRASQKGGPLGSKLFQRGA